MKLRGLVAGAAFSSSFSFYFISQEGEKVAVYSHLPPSLPPSFSLLYEHEGQKRTCENEIQHPERRMAPVGIFGEGPRNRRAFFSYSSNLFFLFFFFLFFFSFLDTMVGFDFILADKQEPQQNS